MRIVNAARALYAHRDGLNSLLRTRKKEFQQLNMMKVALKAAFIFSTAFPILVINNEAAESDIYHVIEWEVFMKIVFCH